MKNREVEAFVPIPLLPDNGIWNKFIYFLNLFLSFLSRLLSLQKSYTLAQSKLYRTMLRIRKGKTFSLQVTIYDSVKFMDYLKIPQMYLNFNILEVFTRNGTLIAVS